MVKFNTTLDATFGALSDPTRRGILERLSSGQTNVAELARPYDMTAPAISRHLRVLERAGLIVRAKHGREHRIRVDPKPIRQARDWIAMHIDFWTHQFDALDDYLKQAQQSAKDHRRPGRRQPRDSNKEKP